MAEIRCRVRSEGRLLVLSPMNAGDRINKSIPNPVRTAYEERHGALKAGDSVLAVVQKGRIAVLSPCEFVTPTAQHPALTATAPVSEPVAPEPAAAADGFVNPYGFVPFMASDVVRHDDLKQGPPKGHESWEPGCYSGAISVTFETVTPLLTTQLTKVKDGVSVLTTRRDAANTPIVAGASVKGAVRAIVEQVTGSRLGVFGGKTPIVRRMLPKEALKVRLAKVQKHDPGRTLVLRPSMVPTPVCQVDPVHTVSVPRVPVLGAREDLVDVQAWLQLVHHPERRNRDGDLIQAAYYFWRVQKLADVDPASVDPGGAPQPGGVPGGLTAVAGEPLVCVRGRLHVTGKSFGDQKHDERLWVESVWDGSKWESSDESQDITVAGADHDEVIEAWQAVIDTFTDGYPRASAIPSYAGDRAKRDEWKALNEGRTVFVTELAGAHTVQLMPGMVTRKRYPTRPRDLIDDKLLPCTNWEEMSPADRMFGWVHEGVDAKPNRDEKTSYRGQCRFGPVTCETEPPGAVPAGHYWTLAALNQPKPSQARFYLRDDQGEPLDRCAKPKGYTVNHRLAGHKVYPTHRVPDGYWDLPADGWQVVDGETKGRHQLHNGRYRSWLAPHGTPAKVTSAIEDWVAPGSTFRLTVRVDNLRRLELAALLWVLDLGKQSPLCVKLGRGRPLGFGAVRMQVDPNKTKLRTAVEQRARYETLAPSDGLTDASSLVNELVAEFGEWLKKAAPKVREAVLVTAWGYTEPIVYPRTQNDGVGEGEPAPTLETYKWFVSNEKGRKFALPLLSQPPNLLPYLPPPRANR